MQIRGINMGFRLIFKAKSVLDCGFTCLRTPNCLGYVVTHTDMDAKARLCVTYSSCPVFGDLAVFSDQVTVNESELRNYNEVWSKWSFIGKTGYVVRDAPIEIQSPNFPNNYDNDEMAMWQFDADDESTLKVTFHHFEVREY